MERFPECGKPIDLELGANLSIDSSQVPAQLRYLIPFVSKWAFVNLSDQDVFVQRMQQHRPEQIDALNSAFDSHAHQLIREWSATLPFDKHVDEFTDEDWQHPYWQFLHVTKLRETTGGYEDNPNVEAMLVRHRAGTRDYFFREATTKADDAFRTGQYAQYVELLSEFSDLLTETQKKKLAVAKRRGEA